MIAAVVLAAGKSSRMAPGHKLLEPFGGSTVIRETVQRLAAATPEPIIVVTGHEAAQVEAALAGVRVRFVRAERYEEGLSASLAAGLGAVPMKAGWVLVALGDMPLVQRDTIERLIDAAGSAGAEGIVPVHAGRRGNPVLWHASMRPALLAVRGDEGGRSLLAGCQVRTVAVDDPGVLMDVDDRHGLERARAAAAGRRAGQ